MRIISVYIGDTHIEFENDMWTGNENIYVDGELVSKEFSWLGTDHFFEVEENGVWVEYILTTGFGWRGITTKIRRNGVLILDVSGMGKCYEIPVSEIRNFRTEELV